jgi:hypothetical protein
MKIIIQVALCPHSFGIFGALQAGPASSKSPVVTESFELNLFLFDEPPRILEGFHGQRGTQDPFKDLENIGFDLNIILFTSITSLAAVRFIKT